MVLILQKKLRQFEASVPTTKRRKSNIESLTWGPAWWWASPFLVAPASHMGVGLSPTCSASDQLPASGLGKHRG